MSTQTLKRAEEPIHVVAAKNLADRITQSGDIKRSDFLEHYAKLAGFNSWNAYRERGEISFTIFNEKGKKAIIKPGTFPVSTEQFFDFAKLVIESASNSGYECDHSGPFIISDRFNHFIPLSKAARGLVLSRNVRHRGFKLSEDLPNDLLASSISEKFKGFEGLIVLDLLGIGADTIEKIKKNAPNAVILHHQFDDYGNWLIDEPLLSKDIKRSPEEKPEMWRDRMTAMVHSIYQANIDYDTRNVPKIDDLNPSNPLLWQFLENFPGYSIDRYKKGLEQEIKSQEQFNFLTMQTRP